MFVRIVLDTASFVTAVRSSDGAAGEVVRMIFREELVPLMDLKLGLEYRDVALRLEHVKASALSKREILELIEAMEAFAEPVEVVTKIRPLSPDPRILRSTDGRRRWLRSTRNILRRQGRGLEFRCLPRPNC